MAAHPRPHSHISPRSGSGRRAITSVEQLKALVDTVAFIGQYVALQKHGRSYKGLCPFHKETTPSFDVTIHGFNCFGCGMRGDVFRFLQELEGITFLEAKRRVEEFVGTPPAVKLPPARSSSSSKPRSYAPLGEPIAVFDYYDESDANLLFQVRKFLIPDKPGGKTFRQRRPHPTEDCWINGITAGYYLKDARTGDYNLNRADDGQGVYFERVPATLYRRSSVARAIADGKPVHVTEGERDADTVTAQGCEGTCNAMGAGKFTAEHAEQLRGAHVVLWRDRDEPGQKHAEHVARLCHGIAASIVLPGIPSDHKDVSDWRQSPEFTIEAFQRVIREAKPYSPQHGITASVSSRETSPGGGGTGGGWRDKLLCKGNGQPYAVLANILTALRHAPEWSGVLAWDEFSSKAIKTRPAPWGGTPREEWTDDDDIHCAEWLQRNGIHADEKSAAKAVESVARENPTHQVREYLESLRWDGKERLPYWLTVYAGVEASSYSEAVGTRFLVGAVARIMRPGVKMDTALVLEGEQGLGKSTLVKTLFGSQFFTDEISEFGSKDAGIQMQAVWCVELAELDHLERSEVGRIKAFMSRATDRFRPPFGRRAVDYPRQCVFFGTCNKQEYLRDETGNRRFWPVWCTDVDIAGVTRDRDQLWAEAVARFKRNEIWWLDTGDLHEAAAEQQADRVLGDPWEQSIAAYVGTLQEKAVSPADVFEKCLGIPLSARNRQHEMRLASCFRSLGWERWRAPAKTKGGPRPHLYRQKEASRE